MLQTQRGLQTKESEIFLTTKVMSGIHDCVPNQRYRHSGHLTKKVAIRTITIPTTSYNPKHASYRQASMGLYSGSLNAYDHFHFPNC
jgi:hypothetical protein